MLLPTKLNLGPSYTQNNHDRFWCNQLLPELLLPFSYSHLLFRLTLDRFPVAGVGVAGPSPNMLEAVLAPSGLVEPNDARPPFIPPPIALCNRGLIADGEYCGAFSLEGDVPNLGDEYCPEPGLAMLDRGELV
jgi:hypothetical protein